MQPRRSLLPALPHHALFAIGALAAIGTAACGGPEETIDAETSDAIVAGARGRPYIAHNTVVTEEGELLRGAYWPLDLKDGLTPTRTQLRAMKNRGLNTLHVYAEAKVFGYPAGEHKTAVDKLVSWTRQDGLYLVLTIGQGEESLNGTFDRTFARNFWNVYAPRYKNERHVIYEIHNEPQKGLPLNVNTRRFERDMFNLIRRRAPNSMILVFSYPALTNGRSAYNDAYWMRNRSNLDWTNAAIAFHGYAEPETQTTNALNYLIGRGLPVIQTEFVDLPHLRMTEEWRIDASQTELYEQTRTSWLSFVHLEEVTTSARLAHVMNGNWIAWGADFGSWPAKNDPPRNRTISLKVPTNNRFVAAGSAGASPLVANRTAVGPSERFVVVPVGAKDVALRAVINNRYVTTRGGRLIASQTSISPTERFEWLEKPNHSVLLRSRANHRFVSADFGLSNPPRLLANRPKAGPWEWFSVCDAAGRDCSL